MMRIFYHNLKSLLCTVFLLLAVQILSAQNYKEGVQQGVIKVKFAMGMTNSLQSMRVSSDNGLTTGITSFDQVSKKVKAQTMFRLFPEPPNSVQEAKLRKHGLHLWYKVLVDLDQNPAEVAALYASLAEVSHAEVVREKVLAPYTVHQHSGVSTSSASTFDDPYLEDQWHYNNTGQTGFEGGSDINLFAAWETTAGSPEIIVSIHDQGVDINHPDLVDNLWINEAELNGQDGIDDDNNGYVDDIHGWNFDKNSAAIEGEYHGTHVAGTVAATNNNGYGVAGVAGGTGNGDGAKLMSLQMMNGGSIEETYIYAANNGAVISQNSWGYTNPGSYEESVLEAIDYFIEEAGDYEGSPMLGGIVIFAAGNSSYDAEWYPGYYENTLSVAAIGPNWQIASYSNYGSWVDIAAPGGDTQLGSINGVLSTLPNEQFGYLDGTSMACPHVSGVAALILANRTSQLTSEVLWNKLVTGVVNIDDTNPGYIGMLGAGHLDAYLAIQNDEGIPPKAISDLSVSGISQEFANLTWTVPVDEDDDQPANFRIYYHTEEITSENLSSLSYDIIKNDSSAGSTINHTVDGLYGLTTYHFAVVSGDRWNNISDISNTVIETTNEGPAISLDTASLSIDLDAFQNAFASADFTILNSAEGILRWEFFTRHKSTALTYSNLQYPLLKSPKSARFGEVGISSASKTRALDVEVSAYQSKSEQYHSYVSNIIGENDTSITNSSATKFLVQDVDGFNLTHIQMYLKHNPATGPVVIEVHKGGNVTKQNVVYALEYMSPSAGEHYAYVTLDEQLYFAPGETFWIVFHVPSGNLFPLGMGPEVSTEGSKNCFMSFDLGQSWLPLEEAIDDENYAWATTALSYNGYLGEYLTLNPSSGEVAGLDQQAISLSANASTLINGTYTANVVFASNDVSNKEIRLPVTLNVTGQQPVLSSIETLDFGSVFNGTTKELSLSIKNTGLGNYNGMTIDISNPKFEISGWPPSRIAATEEINLTITYNPTVAGNDNGLLTLTSYDSDEELKIILFGVGAEPAQISVSPLVQTIDSLTIGDEVSASISVENTGASALRYFVPGYDDSGMSENWDEEFHEYGYKFRTSYEDETDPLTFEFQDISETGIVITDYFKLDGNRYYPIAMGFDFPYYAETMDSLYISSRGFTVFDDEVNPINTPRLDGAPWSPKGYISVLGTYVDFNYGGNVYYQVESDRVIVQYDKLTDGWSGSITGQMVLFANGNIRFYYDDITYSDLTYTLNILIEDYAQTDGILVFDYDHVIDIYDSLVLGFDYPGPDIITSITDASGILMPGESSTIEVIMNTASLYEGLTNRYVNIVSNDPFNGQQIAQIQLNVIEGGESDLTLSKSEIAFGEVFQGGKASATFSIKNVGTAPDTISVFNQSSGDFTVSGETDAIIKPGLAVTYTVDIPTDVIADLSDEVTIEFTSGSSFTISIEGSVVDPPAIVMDLNSLDLTLAHGETSEELITFENTGLANLELVVSGNEWLTLTSEEQATPSYTFEMSNDGSKYQWLDIRETGEHLPHPVDFTNPTDYYPKVNLPWSIDFYGQAIDSFYVSQNGFILFEIPSYISIFPDNVPTAEYEQMIAPLWAFGGFNTYFYPEDEVGIFVDSDDDKIIISWEYLSDNFGMADPVSTQVIFYRNGTMKFQYKLNGSFDVLTSHSVAGVQNSYEDYVLVSPRGGFTHGDGLAFLLTPANKYQVAPSSTIDATIRVDANNIYAGYYPGILSIQTNVPGSENLEKAVNLTVTGDATIESSPSEIDFGQIMAVEDGSLSYNQTFAIKNTGVAGLPLAGMITESNSPDYLIEMYMYDSWFGSWYWSDINYVWSWPTIKPNENAQFRLTYTPTTDTTFTDQIKVGSSLDTLIIPVKAEVVMPPAVRINTEAVISSANTSSDTDTQSISFDNAEGQGPLKYELSIDYERTSAASMSRDVISDVGSLAKKSGLTTQLAATTFSIEDSEFNRELAHEDEASEVTFLGYGGTAAFTTATRFNSGEDGFNVTHILSYYNAYEKPEGTIHYEVRAGGSNVVEAAVLTSGSLDYTFTGGSNNTGEWLTIPVSESQVIYPNEDFYLVITYPFEVYYPQATAVDVEDSEGRYTYQHEGIWYDLQAGDGYPGYGWVVHAAEETFVSGSWVVISSDVTGRIEAGGSVDVSLDFDAAYAQRGDQHAKVVIRSNDPKNPVKKVPVTLHLNEAPVFGQVDESIEVHEASVLVVDIPVKDMEDDTFEVTMGEVPFSSSYEMVDDVLQVTLSPDYEQAGVYNLIFTAKDVFDAESELQVEVEVLKTNRAPEVLISDGLVYNELGTFYANSFAAYFEDPDGDALTYTISVSDKSMANVYVAEDEFAIETLTEGETSIILSATDSLGARTELELPLVISRLVLGSELGSKTIIYQNPVEDYLKVQWKDDWAGLVDVQILTLSGATVKKQTIHIENTNAIDVSMLTSGVYLFRAETVNESVWIRVIKK